MRADTNGIILNVTPTSEKYVSQTMKTAIIQNDMINVNYALQVPSSSQRPLEVSAQK